MPVAGLLRAFAVCREEDRHAEVEPFVFPAAPRRPPPPPRPPRPPAPSRTTRNWICCAVRCRSEVHRLSTGKRELATHRTCHTAAPSFRPSTSRPHPRRNSRTDDRRLRSRNSSRGRASRSTVFAGLEIERANFFVLEIEEPLAVGRVPIVRESVFSISVRSPVSVFTR